MPGKYFLSHRRHEICIINFYNRRFRDCSDLHIWKCILYLPTISWNSIYSIEVNAYKWIYLYLNQFLIYILLRNFWSYFFNVIWAFAWIQNKSIYESELGINYLFRLFLHVSCVDLTSNTNIVRQQTYTLYISKNLCYLILKLIAQSLICKISIYKYWSWFDIYWTQLLYNIWVT